MRTTTMVLGIITATILLLAGACGTVFGGIAGSFEESFDVEISPEGGAISTTEDVEMAGALAIFVAILLYIGSGLAKVAFKTSTILLSVCVALILLLVIVDTTSFFALFYYLALIPTSVGIILMIISRRREDRNMMHAASAVTGPPSAPTAPLPQSPVNPQTSRQAVHATTAPPAEPLDYSQQPPLSPPQYATSPANAKSRTKAGLFGIFLGVFGVHKFYLGYAGAAWTMLGINIAGFVTLFGWMLTIPVTGIITFVEGIIYLTKTDEEFDRIYVQEHRHWF